MKKKRIPVPEPFGTDAENIGSATDMTGLIPANPDDETVEDYQQLYPYLAEED